MLDAKLIDKYSTFNNLNIILSIMDNPIYMSYDELVLRCGMPRSTKTNTAGHIYVMNPKFSDTISISFKKEHSSSATTVDGIAIRFIVKLKDRQAFQTVSYRSRALLADLTDIYIDYKNSNLTNIGAIMHMDYIFELTTTKMAQVEEMLWCKSNNILLGQGGEREGAIVAGTNDKKLYSQWLLEFGE